MKQFIWMLCGIFLSGLLLGTLSACESGAPAPAEPDAAPAEEEEAPPAAVPEEESRRLAFGKVLWDALDKGVLPNGEGLDWTGAEAAEENAFAVCDLDGDGEEELLLRWINASTAGTADFVFRWEDGAVSQEFLEFAGTEFYANGAAKAPWSHNQGWAGRVWPFNLYQYDPETGSYREIGAVDAWDLSVTEGDETLDAAFPRDIDADGDGLVYYILTGDWYQRSRVPSDGILTGRLWETDPVDGTELENWLNFYTEGAEPLSLPLQSLSEENIAALGCPRPDSAEPAS